MKRVRSRVVFGAKALRFMASLALLSYLPFALAQGSTKAQGSTPSGDTADASGKGASNKNGPSGASAQYFVEPDMLVYAASEKIAGEIATEIGKSNSTIVIYDQQSFASLQAYDAFRELVKTIEQGYDAAEKEFAVQPAPTPGVGFAPADIAGVVKTGIDILGALRSTTDLAGQKTDPQENALFAQVAHALQGKASVLIPKMILTEQAGQSTSSSSATPTKDCASIENTIAQSLSCLLNKRAEAETKSAQNAKDKDLGPDASGSTNPILSVTNDLLTQLLNSLATTSGKQQGGNTSKGPSTPGGSLTSASPETTAPSLLSSIITGQRLQKHLSDKAKVLYVGFASAGGSYRVLHNFWLELFYRTPTPAFNGGAVVSYILFNPQDSTVEKARTLRYVYAYSKFKAQKMTTAANLSTDDKKKKSSTTQ